MNCSNFQLLPSLPSPPHPSYLNIVLSKEDSYTLAQVAVIKTFPQASKENFITKMYLSKLAVKTTSQVSKKCSQS